MQIKKKLGLILFFSFCFCSIKINAQNNGMPPPPLEPTKEQKVLIDQLMDVSGFKKYYIKYCNDVIDDEASNKKWNTSKIKIKKNMVNFSDFESSVDNAYALLPVEDLKAIITLIKKHNKDYSEYFWGSYILIDNLRVFAKNYLED
ncbi:MAG: hypothetical protein IPP02_12780 [Chitinophagaceae bacterium]|jgi:hypothetical protein|nr:hypothetical protein [Chitinophagaceae bacterium]MBK8301527.1 hypothetical protein [Chitinophagaceae bacterium]MBK9464575.1 hypothetical protein [Chitinophagaceae bacterium]MBK9660069.1 hypothetical protein [Chitinophagaceae bacterium]MBK9939228.1 hypothetical protein [Chitinophagaceae bacterium]